MATLANILQQATGAFLNRGDLEERYEEVRSDAATRANRLLEEAKREGAGLLALAARHGAEMAREYGLPLLAGTARRRRRSSLRIWAAAAAVAAIAAVVVATSRD